MTEHDVHFLSLTGKHLSQNVLENIFANNISWFLNITIFLFIHPCVPQSHFLRKPLRFYQFLKGFQINIWYKIIFNR